MVNFFIMKIFNYPSKKFISYSLCGILILSLFFLNLFKNNQFEYIIYNKYYLSVIFFTIYQAFLGAFFSLILSLVFLRTAYKFTKSQFGWLINRIISLPFFLPSIIGCLSIVMVFGNNGII